MCVGTLLFVLHSFIFCRFSGTFGLRQNSRVETLSLPDDGAGWGDALWPQLKIASFLLPGRQGLTTWHGWCLNSLALEEKEGFLKRKCLNLLLSLELEFAAGFVLHPRQTPPREAESWLVQLSLWVVRAQDVSRKGVLFIMSHYLYGGH